MLRWGEPDTVEAGKWYLVVECRNPKCGHVIAFREAPDDPGEQFTLPEEIPLRCPHCGREAVYRPFDLRRRQA